MCHPVTKRMNSKLGNGEGETKSDLQDEVQLFDRNQFSLRASISFGLEMESNPKVD